MGHGVGRSYRVGGAGTGDLHGHEGLRARVSRLRRQGEAGLRGRLMPDRTFLSWPFFDDAHRRLGNDVEAWAARELAGPAAESDLDARARALVRGLGDAGWIRWCVPSAHGGARDPVDVRSVCLLREALSRRDGLADAAFAMQGLG